jgi:hypothetical protein
MPTGATAIFQKLIAADRRRRREPFQTKRLAEVASFAPPETILRLAPRTVPDLDRGRLQLESRNISRDRVERPSRDHKRMTARLPPPLLNTPMRKDSVGSHLCAPALPSERRWPKATRGGLRRPPRWTSTRTFVASLMRPASALSSPAAADAKLRGK